MNLIFPKFKEYLLGLALSGATVKVALVDTLKYTPNSTDQYLAALPVGAIIGTPVKLDQVSWQMGQVSAQGLTFNLVTGEQVGALLVYIDTGSAATSQLIGWIDQCSGNPGWPLTPTGASIPLTWQGAICAL